MMHCLLTVLPAPLVLPHPPRVSATLASDFRGVASLSAPQQISKGGCANITRLTNGQQYTFAGGGRHQSIIYA
jgi:hypothetical protein